jgi:glutamine---fructose-6-phosphate transaminase (isomerizing)
MPTSSELPAFGIIVFRNGAAMLAEFSAIEGAYLRDILDQPRALTDTLAALDTSEALRSIAVRLRDGAFRTVVLTGMGSSFHALHPTNLALIDHGFTAVMIETAELVHYAKQLFDPTTLIIAVSQSGKSAEMVRLLEVNRQRSAIVAVTNTAASPLAQAADANILTTAGHEFSVSCKTYLCALMALEWLSSILCDRDLSRVREQLKCDCPTVQEYLSAWKQHVRTLAELLAGTRHLFLVGRGASLAAVGTGALIVKESDHFHAEGMSSASFRHGPLEMISDEIFVLVFAGDLPTRDLNQRLLDDIRQQAGRTELVGEESGFAACKLPAASRIFRPILEILPVQMVTLALAAQVGREPGRFELASKVTTRE